VCYRHIFSELEWGTYQIESKLDYTSHLGEQLFLTGQVKGLLWEIRPHLQCQQYDSRTRQSI
jgi:hypothetical protein